VNREQTKLNQSHDRMTFTMQSPAERDAWMRAFPHPLPVTHRMEIGWSVNALGQNVLTAQPVEKSRDELMESLVAEPPAALNGKPQAPAAPPSDVLTQLDSLGDDALAVEAAQAGVELKGNESRAQVMALILDKLTAPPAK
jgi:hypothetical protein